ncbi:hypothetical protein GCM10028783_41450 [Modestobacter muralis]
MVLGVVILPTHPPSTAEPTLRRIDRLGIVLSSATLIGALLFLRSLEAEPAWWALGVGGVAVLRVVEARVAEPFLDLRALRSSPDLAGM